MAVKRCCATCKWRSDDFTSACTNGDSPKRADFVASNDKCEEWDGGECNTAYTAPIASRTKETG